MPDTVLLALKNKLARYEASGEADRVKQVKARIAELEKGEKKAAALPMTLSPQPVAAVPAAKPIVKKAAKKSAGKKK